MGKALEGEALGNCNALLWLSRRGKKVGKPHANKQGTLAKAQLSK